MYLTRIDMSVAHRGTQRALRDCQQMHRMVTGLFGESRADADVLYRLRYGRGSCSIYLYSSMPVKRDRILPNMRFQGERDMTEWLNSLTKGQICHFDLLAWPSKKVPCDGRKNSRRRVLRTEGERLAWLMRKGQQNGFELLTACELETAQQVGYHDACRGGSLHVDSYHYQGTLQIYNVMAFRSALCGGIGPGKAYGLGMLLLTQ